MTAARSIHNLALVGFMGSGKSVVGRQVADALHFAFLDTDRVIEARAGKTVSEIFQQDGEPAFRCLPAISRRMRSSNPPTPRTIRWPPMPIS